MHPVDAATASPAEFVRLEAAALADLATRMEGPMQAALAVTLRLLAHSASASLPLILTGVGKSGIIAAKLAATFRSTGTPASFLHPAEALHGDLGLVSRSAPVLALSLSGETDEILALLPSFSRLGCPVIALTGDPSSSLALRAAVVLDCSVSCEACPHNLAPTASTTVMLALGDALAMDLSRRAGFTPAHFAALHPGGRLGRRLARVRDLMHAGDQLPVVGPSTPMPEVIHEMSRKKLGMTTVVTPAHGLLGIIVDGDLRRLLERVGPQLMHRTAGEIMNVSPQVIGPAEFASEALNRMESLKITALVVVEKGQAVGILHLHDILGGGRARS